MLANAGRSAYRLYAAFVLALATVFGLSACATALPRVAGSERPSAGLTPGATSAASGIRAPPGWQVFTDPGAGYTLLLPPGVNVHSGKSAAGIYTTRVQFQIPGTAGYQGFVVRTEPNPGGQGIEQILDRLYRMTNSEEPPEDLIARTQSVLLAGLSAVRFAGTGDDFAIVIPYRDRVFFLAPVHGLATAAADPQTLQLFQQILDTFRVTE